MTPLEAAKALTDPEQNGATYMAATPDDGDQRYCMACNRRVTDHAASCPWLAMPQIVAALEAAENIGEWLRDDAGRCIECGGTEDRCRPDICTVAQFKLALKGEEVPA